MIERGWIDAELAAEFPELALHYVAIEARSGPSPAAVRARLRGLSSRFRGVHAIAMRRNPVPRAYRVFFRQIGLDPDTERTPIEAAALQRLIDGQFASKNLLDDALLISLIETGVPIWALDSVALDGPLGIRGALPGERFAAGAPPLAAGRLVVADAVRPRAVLFGELAAGEGVGDLTRAMTLFAVQVPGVPGIHVEEAIWQCTSVLGSPRG
ncbi:MAG: hypothetical protein NVSMB51_21340 [Solirubrobacteraceae bacterium]